MEEKKVSIIIPVYNSELSITRCVQSAVQQTYKNIEIICVNDGSSDKSRELLENLSQGDSRIIVINKKNSGVSAARNTGIQAASGDYIQFIDSDDYIDIDMTRLLVENMEINQCQLVVCGYKSTNGKTRCTCNNGLLSKNELYGVFPEVYSSTYLNPPWNKLYVKSLIHDGFPENMSLGEDLVFNLKYISQIDRLQILPWMLYNYEMGNPNSLTSIYKENAIENLEAKLNEISLFIPQSMQKAIFELLQEQFITDYRRCFKGMISCGRFTNREICEKIKAVTKTEVWEKTILGKSSLNKENRWLLCGNYNKFIRYVKLENQIFRIKKTIKK